jgi:hypothetical protein
MSDVLDWLAFRVMDVVALMDRSVWTTHRLVTGVSYHFASAGHVVGLSWKVPDGWRPVRYV